MVRFLYLSALLGLALASRPSSSPPPWDWATKALLKDLYPTPSQPPWHSATQELFKDLHPTPTPTPPSRQHGFDPFRPGQLWQHAPSHPGPGAREPRGIRPPHTANPHLPKFTSLDGPPEPSLRLTMFDPPIATATASPYQQWKPKRPSANEPAPPSLTTATTATPSLATSATRQIKPRPTRRPVLSSLEKTATPSLTKTATPSWTKTATPSWTTSVISSSTLTPVKDVTAW